MKIKIVSVRSVTTRMNGENLYLTEDEARDLFWQLCGALSEGVSPVCEFSTECNCRDHEGYIPSAPLPFTPLWQFEWYS